MTLSRTGMSFYHKLYQPLLDFVNRKLTVVPIRLLRAGDRTAIISLRDAVFANRTLIGSYVRTNPVNLSPRELEIVAGLKHARAGNFFVVRHYKHYSIFMAVERPNDFYRVESPVDPFEVVVGVDLPVVVKTVLLPFKGKIIFDAVLSVYDLPLDPECEGKLFGCAEYARCNGLIVTSLPKSRPKPAAKVKKFKNI